MEIALDVVIIILFYGAIAHSVLRASDYGNDFYLIFTVLKRKPYLTVPCTLGCVLLWPIFFIYLAIFDKNISFFRKKK